MTQHTHRDWNQFTGETVPGTFSLQPVFFENVRRGYSIIDLGCGAGRVCFDLLRRGYGPLVGIDQNEHCIRFAREKIQNHSGEKTHQCRFECSDALHTGFGDGSFDTGIILAVLTTLTTPGERLQILKEARRIVRRDGGLYLGEFMQTWHHPLYYNRYVLGEKETGEMGSFLARDSSGTISFQAHHFGERELVDLLQAAGFQIARCMYLPVTTQTGNHINGVAIWAV